VVRINGTLPDISTLGSEEKSERAAEVKRQGTSTNTSCSIFARIETDQKIFHMLVDIGQGIVKSIEKGASDLGFKSSSFIPDALLLTHSHDDHIKELPVLVNKVNEEDESRGKNLKIFCTVECQDQIIKKFPQLSEKTTNNGNRVSLI
jgi:phosphoribosyl 1,2-cyclic phosphodiesterase